MSDWLLTCPFVHAVFSIPFISTLGLFILEEEKDVLMSRNTQCKQVMKTLEIDFVSSHSIYPTQYPKQPHHKKV
jgi:hypothetical protein